MIVPASCKSDGFPHVNYANFFRMTYGGLIHLVLSIGVTDYGCPRYSGISPVCLDLMRKSQRGLKITFVCTYSNDKRAD